MKTLFGLSLVALLMAACNASAPEMASSVNMESTTRTAEAPKKEADNNLKIAREWVSEDGKTLHCNLDGRFVAQFDSEAQIQGTWSLSEDAKSLQLLGDQAQEGKGAHFKQTYEVLSLDEAQMTVKDEAGKTWVFKAG